MGFKRIVMPFVVLSLALSGCTKKNSGALEYGLDVKNTLRVNIDTEPPSLDWSKSTDVTSASVEDQIMEGLVAFDLNDPEIKTKPALATEWKASADAKTWTFTLRKGVKWTDRVEFTGQHVLEGWERLLNPNTASEYAYFLFDVKNARAYNSGKIKDFKQVGVKLGEAGELIVELENPMAYFPQLLTHHSTYPQRRDVVEKHGDKWTEPGNIQTLGPYKLKIWDHDKAIVLERNEDYYGEKAKIKNVLCYMITEYSTALNLFEAGKLDLQKSLPFKELPAWKNRPGYRKMAALVTYYYGLNTRKPPFNNLKVRKAFAMAIDRKQIVDLLAADHTPLYGWIPPGMVGFEKDGGIQFNAEAAAKLLDEAGFKDRSKFPKVTLAFNTNENHQRIAENVQAQLKKNLGIDVQIQNEEWKVYLSRLRTDTPSIYRMGWAADYPDPSTFVSLMTSFSENNHTGWGNKRYDDLVKTGATSLDEAARRRAYAEAQKILTEDEVPVIPVYAAAKHTLVSERVQGLPISAMEKWEFKGASLK